MDPNKLKVADLRNELSSRGLDVKGTKPVLVKRLKDALDKEAGREPSKDVAPPTPRKSSRSSTEENEESNAPAEKPKAPPTPKPSATVKKSEENNVPKTPAKAPAAKATETPKPQAKVSGTPKPQAKAPATPKPQANAPATPKPQANAPATKSQANAPATKSQAKSPEKPKVESPLKPKMESPAKAKEESPVKPKVGPQTPAKAAEDSQAKVDDKSADVKVEKESPVKPKTGLTTVKEETMEDETEEKEESEEHESEEEEAAMEVQESESTEKSEPVTVSKRGEKRKRSVDGESPERPVKRAKSPIREDEPPIDPESVLLNWYDSDLHLQIDKGTFLSAKPLNDGAFGYFWAGARASHGIALGKVCYEVKITEKLKWEDTINNERRRYDRRRSRDDRRWSKNDSAKEKDSKSKSGDSKKEKDKEDCTKDKHEEKEQKNGESEKDDATQEDAKEQEDAEMKPADSEETAESNDKAEESEEQSEKADEAMETDENKNKDKEEDVKEQKDDNEEQKEDDDEEQKEDTKEQKEDTKEQKGDEKDKSERDQSHIPTHFFRVGWSVPTSAMQLGEDKYSYCYDSSAKLVQDKELTDYGITFGEGDVIGAYLDMSETTITMHFTINDKVQPPIEISKDDLPDNFVLYPHILSRNYAFEINFGKREEPWFPIPEEFSDYKYMADFEGKIRGPARPEKRENCEVILMCGLPACGKSYWVKDHLSANLDKKYNVIGNSSLLERMTINGEPIKNHYRGKWGLLIDKLQRCLIRLVSMAANRRRNFIIDQSNVFPAGQRRKMRPFEGFKRKAVIIVLEEDEQIKRQGLQEAQEGKEVPESMIRNMKAVMTLPEVGDWLDEVSYVGVEEGRAREIVKKYNESAKASGGGRDKRFSRDRWGYRRNDYRDRSNYSRSSYGQSYSSRDRYSSSSWRDSRSRDYRGGRYDQRERDYPRDRGYGGRSDQRWGGGSSGSWGSGNQRTSWNQQTFGNRNYNWGGSNQGWNAGNQGQGYGGGSWNPYSQANRPWQQK